MTGARVPDSGIDGKTTLANSASGGAVVALMHSAMRGNAALQATFDEPDPRPFYRCQNALDYQIPALCGMLVRTIAHELRAGNPATVVDIGCSYGIGAAVMTRDLTLEEIYQNYTDTARATLSVAQLRRADRPWYTRHRSASAVRVFGFDASAHAVRFAVEVGLLDRGWVCDLEKEPPPAGLTSAMREVDLLVGTGIFSYITPLTVERLLGTHPDGVAPWMLSFPLRFSDYRPFSALLDQHGMRTVRLNAHPLVQQRVGTEDIRGLISTYLGELPPVSRRNGHLYYLADCFLSVPQDHGAAGIIGRLARTVDRSPLACVL